MADFKKGGFGGGGQGFKKSFGRPSFEGRQGFKHGGGKGGDFRGGERRGDSQKPQMYSAICSSCGKKCEVPFKPSGDRPVLCSDCFNLRKDFPQKDGPRRETAVYRKDSPNNFSAHSDIHSSQIEDLKRQIESLSAKLDKVLAHMHSSSLSHVVKHAVEEPAAPAKPKKKAVKKKVK